MTINSVVYSRTIASDNYTFDVSFMNNKDNCITYCLYSPFESKTYKQMAWFEYADFNAFIREFDTLAPEQIKFCHHAHHDYIFLDFNILNERHVLIATRSVINHLVRE